MTLKRLIKDVRKGKTKYLWDDIQELWCDFYVYRAYDYITRIFPERLKRATQYFMFGWGNKDFDGFFIDQLVLFKLKRLEYLFINYGYHSEECENYKPKMKSIKLAIKLLQQYCNQDKDHMFIDLHDKKWGKMKSKHILIEGTEEKPLGPYYRWETSRPNANTLEEIEQERKEFREACDKDERREEKLRVIAYKIIIKYGHYWWD